MRRCISSTTTVCFNLGRVSRHHNVIHRSLFVLLAVFARGVVNYLKGKSRGELDSSYSTSLALGEVILKLFESDDLVIDRPDMMDLPNHDPNHSITPEECDYMGRTAEWILATWNTYIKPKYKKVLTKWYKQTGGGGRELEDFVNYCVLNHGSPVAVWLAWVYAIDHDANFILASVSAGRPPQFISGNQEAGFEGTSSNADGSPSEFVTPVRRRRLTLSRHSSRRALPVYASTILKILSIRAFRIDYV